MNLRTLKDFKQRGAVIMFTAISLPLLFVCGALALDLGYMYMQKAQLQNAADAAALAGAREYISKHESVDSHPKANDMALKYISGKKNASTVDGNDIENISSFDKDTANLLSDFFKSERNLKVEYKAKIPTGEDTRTRYGVELTVNAPSFFMKYFTKDGYTVSAKSTVVIATSSKNAQVQKMFIFKRDLSSTNSLNEPDNLSSQNNRWTVFDGQIMFTSPESNTSVTYSTQQNIDRFTTSLASSGSYNDAKKSKAEFNPDGTLKSGSYVQAEHGSYDYQSYIDFFNGQRASLHDRNLNLGSQQAFKLGDYQEDIASGNVLIAQNTNLSITIDKPLSNGPSNKDTPVYLFVPASVGHLELRIRSDTVRPLIIYYDGTGDIELQFDQNKKPTFRGIIFAPHMDERYGRLQCNLNNSTFSGSIIITGALDLQGGGGTYKFESFQSAPTPQSDGNDKILWGDD